MNLDLSGKTAIVCGSSQGIGKACAIELAKLGANICLIARNEQRLSEVRIELTTEGEQRHDLIAVDFSAPNDLKKAIENYLQQNSDVHVLVNNTGGPPGGPAFEARPEEFLQAINNHLICNQILAQAVVPGMKKTGYGRIINIISTSVKQPLNGLGVSNAVRGAVANWAKTLANELGQFGITVNNVLPGATETVRLEAIIKNNASKTGKTEKEVADQMRQSVPMKRFGQAEELANAVAFLASPAASYINGINLPVDGGRTMSL